MNKREAMRHIRAARERVEREIADHSRSFGGGMSGEGYSGGYRDALDDVMLLLEGDCIPNRRRYYEEAP